jgi:hypothetical protein
MRYFVRASAVTVFALVLAFLIGFIGTGLVFAAEVEGPTKTVKTKRVTYAEKVHGYWFVEFNDGSAHHLKRCRYEDSRNCYWNAGAAGNGKGKSFADLKGTAYYWKK